MNVYMCWHQGNFGYCCRMFDSSWMFVPELGQPDNRIHKSIPFDDLIFTNPMERMLERENEIRLNKKWNLADFIWSLLFTKFKPLTIGGRLFLANY